MDWKWIVAGVCLLFNGYMDLKDREILTISTIIVHALFFLVEPGWSSILCILLIVFVTRDNKIAGGADFDAVLLLLNAIGIWNTIEVLICACVCGILYCVLKKDREIPFVAMIAVAYFFFLISELMQF